MPDGRSAAPRPAAMVPPVARQLEQAFDRIARTRMRDVPILNPALRVEAVGFRRWSGRWIGVLVTPWFMSLVLLPDERVRAAGRTESLDGADPLAPASGSVRAGDPGTPLGHGRPFAPAERAAPASEIWNPVPVRETRRYALPAGLFEFIGGHEDGVGEFQTCSLFSPMFEFADHDAARATALAALDALFDPGTAGATDTPPSSDAAGTPSASDADREPTRTAPPAGHAADAVPAAAASAPSPGRRRFLGGR